MFNRRHLRIKILHALYAYFQDEDRDAVHTEKELQKSLTKMYEMHIWLLCLIVEMQDHAIDKIEAGRNKKLPTQEDLHPNTKFVTNALVRQLVNSKNLNQKAEDLTVNWAGERDLSKKIFRDLIEKDDYKEYMESSTRGYEHDKEYLLRFFKRHMVNVELLHDFFEEKSVLWSDDLDLAAGMTVKFIKTMQESDSDITLMPLWRDPEDEKNFLNNLFKKTLSLGEDSQKMIAEAAKNWDFDRIALMDQILMKMAIAEATTFSDIPLKVTLNEYIELSKYYSTPKSAGFINGILDQLFDKLQEDGKIKRKEKGFLRKILYCGAMGLLLMTSCSENTEGKITSDDIYFDDGYDRGTDKYMPKIKFEEEDFNFGIIIEGEKINHTYHFENVGQRDLIISDVQASCGCTTSKDYTKKPIKPGEKGKIEVEFDSSDKSGSIKKSVTVLTNGKPSKKTLFILGDVIALDKADTETNE